ncbi:MAG: hypothetical protein AAGU19_08145 [Prolixibacteraceae bacterium]
MKSIIVFILLALMAGCKTIKYVPVETVKIEYKDKLRIEKDTIVQHDSIYVKDSGDTVLIERFKYLYKYRDRIVRDSIHVQDSIQVPYPVEVPVEVNKLTRWQVWQLMAFRILVLVGGLYGLYRLKKKGILGRLLSFLK